MLILDDLHGKVHSLTFSPNGRYLASAAGQDQWITIHDLYTGQCLQKPEHHRRIVSLVFAPGEDLLLASCNTQGEIYSYRGEKQQWQRLETVNPIPNFPIRLAFSSSGSHLAATCTFPQRSQARRLRGVAYSTWTYGGISLWEWDRGSRLLDASAFRASGVNCLSFIKDAQLLAGAGLERYVHVWDRKSGEVLFNFDHAQKVHFLAADPQGRTIASATVNGYVKVWDIIHGTKQCILHSRTSKALQAIAYSPDGTILATADSEGQARLWSVATGQQVHAFDWDIGAVHSVAFSADGMRAAVGGYGRVVIWDLDFED